MEKKKPWARKKIKKMRQESEKLSSGHEVKRYELPGIVLFAIAAVCACGLLNFNVGFVGVAFAKGLTYLFGVGAWPLVLLMFFIAGQIIIRHVWIEDKIRAFGVTVFFVTGLSVYHHFAIRPGAEILPESLARGGGLVGGLLLFIMRKFFGIDGSIIMLGAVALGALLLATTWSLARGYFRTKNTAEKVVNKTGDAIGRTYVKASLKADEVEEKISRRIKDSFYNQEADPHFAGDFVAKQDSQPEAEIEPFNFEPIEITPPEEPKKSRRKKNEEVTENDNTAVPKFSIEYSSTNKKAELVDCETGEILDADVDMSAAEGAEADADSNEASTPVDSQVEKEYVLPKVEDILNLNVKEKNAELEQEIANNAQILAKALENFRVKATIVNACHGPAVTRYELEPAPGVKVSKITNLADDLALALAAFSVRIEPIPGKSAIGIEVPNKELEGVQLRDVLECDLFDSAKSKLTVGLGMDIGGQAIFADLAKMPHLLVAGATGSGKSVCINTIITSILFKASPDEVKFILIDPKMVELSNYNGIPHLMVPVVTDAKKAASVLNWSVQEMEKRYSLFAAAGVRDMERYNRLDVPEKMPAVVIIIDELADLMMVAPHDVEDAICRLAQKARAAGIHLVLATQRPSVDVITGVIKANIPSRISFAVSSQVDSRTILDMGGAEKLLGKGDMLFYPVGSSKPRRVQGAFVSDGEVDKLLDYIRAQGQEMEANEEIISFTENDVKEKDSKAEKKSRQNDQDELLVEAVKMVLSTGQASSSSIQRRFRIGYTRAARLIDTMEALHIVGPSMGSKPREILMTTEQAMAVVLKPENDE